MSLLDIYDILGLTGYFDIIEYILDHVLFDKFLVIYDMVSL